MRGLCVELLFTLSLLRVPLSPVIASTDVANATATTTVSDGPTIATISYEAMKEPDETSAEAKQRLLDSLQAENFLIGIALAGVQRENGSQCGSELSEFLKAVTDKRAWSLKVIDSYGSPPTTFTWGNYFWFSSKWLCDDLNTPLRISLAQTTSRHRVTFNVTSPFPLRFTVVYLRFDTPHYIDLKLPFESLIHVGLCLPRSCDPQNILGHTETYFNSGILRKQRDFQLKTQAIDVKAPDFNWSFFKKTGTVLFLCIFVFVVLSAVIASVIHKSRVKLYEQQQSHIKSSTTTTTSTTISMQQLHQQQLQQHHVEDQTPAKASDLCCFEKFFLCFRISDNYERIMQLDKSESFLTAIAGFRTIICLWVTVFHVYYYSLYAMANAPMIFVKLEHISIQPILQACFYVDVFFVMSAFLHVYNFLTDTQQLEQIKRNNFLRNLKLYLKAILYRYLRLTPVLIVTMVLSDAVTDAINLYSPFRLSVHSGFYCKTNWWYNLLYIHNFLDMNNICCSWTWYLGCEMQFYMLFTALLFLYTRNPRLAQGVFAALSLGLMTIAWMCNYHNGITFQIDVIYSTLDELYVKPWVRICPYIGGVALGWVFWYYKATRPHSSSSPVPVDKHPQPAAAVTVSTSVSMTTTTTGDNQPPTTVGHPPPTATTSSSSSSASRWRLAFWIFCSLLYVATNFMSYWRETPVWLVAIIQSWGKLLFALCVGGVIALCACGYGGPLNSLLSSRPFLFLNKFCYSMYMIAPVIVIACFGLRLEATNFTEVGSGMDFFAVSVMSIASAMLMVLLVELPIQRVSNAFLRGGRSRKGMDRTAEAMSTSSGEDNRFK